MCVQCAIYVWQEEGIFKVHRRGGPVRRYLQLHQTIHSHRDLEKLSEPKVWSTFNRRTLEDIFKESIQMIHDSEKARERCIRNEGRIKENDARRSG